MEYLGQYQDIDLVNHGLKIGDTVHIVEDPYMLCPFNWTSYMTCYCGKETVITDIKIKPDGRPDSFRIAVDGGDFIKMRRKTPAFRQGDISRFPFRLH